MYFSLGCFIALASSGLIFSKRVRDSGMQTVQEMVNREFGKRAEPRYTVPGTKVRSSHSIASSVSSVKATFSMQYRP